MVVEYIRYTVASSDRGEELLRACLVAVKQLDAAAECMAYELSRCEEDPNSWILRIQWRSTEEHLQVFSKGPRFASFLRAIRGFMPEITEMRYYRVTGVSARKPGFT
jgi:quinol monooxygenase YgiN